MPVSAVFQQWQICIGGVTAALQTRGIAGEL
jgi:hypothetical protein